MQQEYMRGVNMATWEELPDIPLYMDQVITYLERQLDSFQQVQSEALVTPSMINNYVKSKLLPKPEKKKYGKEHLARLLIVCTLKQVLPIQQIKELLGLIPEGRMEQALNHYSAEQSQVFEKLDVRQAEENLECAFDHAVHLLIEANAKRMTAQLLLKSIAEGKNNPEKDDRDGNSTDDNGKDTKTKPSK